VRGVEGLGIGFGQPATPLKSLMRRQFWTKFGRDSSMVEVEFVGKHSLNPSSPIWTKAFF